MARVAQERMEKTIKSSRLAGELFLRIYTSVAPLFFLRIVCYSCSIMMIQQTMTIPADKRLYFDLPGNMHEGEAEVTLKVKPKIKEKRHFSLFRRASVMDFYGCLKDSKTFAGDPMEIQRKMRDEWER
jgi:hypothetical protein